MHALVDSSLGSASHDSYCYKISWPKGRIYKLPLIFFFSQQVILWAQSKCFDNDRKQKEIQVRKWQILPAFLHSCPVFSCVTQPVIWILCCEFNHNRRCILFLPLPHVQSLYSNRSQKKIAFFHLWIIQFFTGLPFLVLFSPPFLSHTYE